MIELELRNVDFYGGRKTGEARERVNNKLNSHEVPEPRIKPTTHWHHIGERQAYYRNTTHASHFYFWQKLLHTVAACRHFCNLCHNAIARQDAEKIALYPHL
jgi:hypothetical protein